jgi:GntR family transcriptional repressor for pyruvate dehydrogenase complex
MKKSVKPIQRDRVPKQIEQQILAMIRDGQLVVGERLPSERELSEMFSVSRASVREAMRSLEHLGVIDVRQGGGTFVREARLEDLGSRITAAFAVHPNFLWQIYEARCVIEPALGRSAAQNATPEDIAQLHEILERQAEKLLRGESTVEEDNAFHAIIMRAAGNSILQTMAEACLNLLQPSRENYLQTRDRQTTSLRTHRMILDAIERHDPDATYEASLHHIQATIGKFVRDQMAASQEEGDSVS